VTTKAIIKAITTTMKTAKINGRSSSLMRTTTRNLRASSP